MKAERDRDFYVLREFVYDDDTGVVDRGQVVRLQGHVNDQKLVRTRYLAPCHPGQELVQCGRCGALFIDEYSREQHGNLRHRYECECGWTPGLAVKDKKAALARHRARCEVVASLKEDARLRQRQEIAAQPGRDQGIDAGQEPEPPDPDDEPPDDEPLPDTESDD